MSFSPASANGQAVMASSKPVVIASDQSAVKVDPVGGTTGDSVSSQTALTTTAIVKATAGKLKGVVFLNVNSAPAYIQVFDVATATTVTLGTTAPTYVIPVPAASTAANGAGIVANFPQGIAHANGIKVAATTTPTGATAVSTGLTGFVTYV